MKLTEEVSSLYEAKAIPLPEVDFNLVGFGMDTNGNSVIKLTNSRGKGFSIQTNKGGDFQKVHSMKGQKAKDLDDEQKETIAQVVKEYIDKHGTKTMKG